MTVKIFCRPTQGSKNQSFKVCFSLVSGFIFLSEHSGTQSCSFHFGKQNRCFSEKEKQPHSLSSEDKSELVFSPTFQLNNF